MSLMTPKSDDPAQQQSQAILKFLPLMIGWFSLNVPSGLGLYWITNNVITTATTLLIRKTVNADMALAGMDGSVSASTAVDLDPPKTQGFGRKFGEVIQSESDGTKITIKPPGSKPAASVPAQPAPADLSGSAIVDAEFSEVASETQAVSGDGADGAAAGVEAADGAGKKKRKGSKKKKKSK